METAIHDKGFRGQRLGFGGFGCRVRRISCRD